MAEIRVIIIEDDPFARNWMVLITARDWRTRVIGELSGPSQLLPFLKENKIRPDFILMDTDIPGGEDWIPFILSTISSFKSQPKILCTGLKPNPKILRQLAHPAFVGYILKDEIRYSLAWAISAAIDGKWVITNSILQLSFSIGFSLPKPCAVLDGLKILGRPSERQEEVARLAFLFSMERGELADELGVGEDYVYQLVSRAYKSLGIEEILSNPSALEDYFGKSSFIRSQIKRINKAGKSLVKAKGMETIAFHMLTMPEITELK